MIKLFLLIILLGLISCKNAVKNVETKIVPQKVYDWSELSFEEQIKQIKENTSKDSILSNDIQFINDSILIGKFKLDISRYESENSVKKCYPIRLSKKNIREFYNQGFNNLGDLNGDGKKDSVFVLGPLNYCETGDAYYFTDNKIPRIITESNCCHPESIFSIGDIDEDGGNEIAEYYSSCTSNFKRINIWTLKNNQWILVEKFGFFYNNGKYEAFKDFKKLYRKVAKNKFKFLEIADMSADGKLVMEWKTVIMK